MESAPHYGCASPHPPSSFLTALLARLCGGVAVEGRKAVGAGVVALGGSTAAGMSADGAREGTRGVSEAAARADAAHVVDAWEVSWRMCTARATPQAREQKRQ
eukprot:1160136-Pelagomonas_calceolata.AAC.8